ncbi:MAG: hypothetical protein J6R18_06975 [Kiritimatiellae bacterium]|nr:hypothetical protein [Kiritimatiellia bacterium]
MRLGAAAYDVASLLFDPYVPMDETTRKLLIELTVKSCSQAPAEESIVFAAIQRLCQALGAYCRLGSAGQTGFEKFIPRALNNLHQASHSAGFSNLAEFIGQIINYEKMI